MVRNGVAGKLPGLVVVLLGVAAPAVAGIPSAPVWVQASHVEDAVTDLSNGTWSYEYTVFNDAECEDLPGADCGSIDPAVIVDWELPWFGDAGIDVGSISQPNGWAYAIEDVGAPNSATGWDGVVTWQNPGDPFYQGADSPFTGVTQVLHWYLTVWPGDGAVGGAINPGASLGGFGFIAGYDATDAPYQASWAQLPTESGDPAFPLGALPASPAVTGIGSQLVPEPATLLLLGTGLAGAGAVLRRSRRRERRA